MKLRQILFLIAVSLMLTTACDRPKCKNKNPIFDQHSPTSNEYKRELVSQINQNGYSNVKYWIADYLETDSSDYLILDVQSKDLCATGYFRIVDSNKIEDIIRTKGKGYRGARIRGFEFTTVEGENFELVFSDLKGIID